MNSERFNLILERRFELIKSVLGAKAAEYVRGDDRLYNFNRAAVIQDISPVKALQGMMMKHLVSVLDMIDDKSKGKSHGEAHIEEKITDLICYLILLEAMLKDV